MGKTSVATMSLCLASLESLAKRLDAAYGNAVKKGNDRASIRIDDLRKAIQVTLAYRERLANLPVEFGGVYETTDMLKGE